MDDVVNIMPAAFVSNFNIFWYPFVSWVDLLSVCKSSLRWGFERFMAGSAASALPPSLSAGERRKSCFQYASQSSCLLAAIPRPRRQGRFEHMESDGEERIPRSYHGFDSIDCRT